MNGGFTKGRCHLYCRPLVSMAVKTLAAQLFGANRTFAELRRYFDDDRSVLALKTACSKVRRSYN